MGIFPISTFHCVWWHCGITVVLLIFTTSDPNICVCVRACTALKVCTMKCRFFVSACNCESLCCLQAPLHLIVAGSAECIYSLFSLSVSVPLSSCVLYPPRTIFLHHPCASTGMCLRAWATSGHSLSTSATCLMTQPTSAWLGRRRASRRFLSKVYESLSLEESFFQEGEGFFFFFLPGLANAVIWTLRGLTALFLPCVCVCHLFISMLFMPHSGTLLPVVCSVIFNGYVASETFFMFCLLSCIVAVALYILMCSHMH